MYLPQFKLKWKGLQSITMLESKREMNGKVSIEKRYYISSLKPNAEIIGSAKNLKQMRGNYEANQPMQKYCCGHAYDVSNCLTCSFIVKNCLENT
jgi:hypothetical protein